MESWEIANFTIFGLHHGQRTLPDPSLPSPTGYFGKSLRGTPFEPNERNFAGLIVGTFSTFSRGKYVYKTMMDGDWVGLGWLELHLPLLGLGLLVYRWRRWSYGVETFRFCSRLAIDNRGPAPGG